MGISSSVDKWKKAWTMQEYAAQGLSHVEMSIPCQDKVCHATFAGAFVIALADGAGSAAHSEIGAERATEVTCDFISKNFDSISETINALEVKKSILNNILDAFHKIVDDTHWELSSLACTLLFVAVKGTTCLVGHIGDGVICCRIEETLRAISLPSNGEFANSTTFVTSPNALSDFRLYKGETDKIDGFCLMSDGAAESLYSRKTHEIANMVGKVFTATAYLKYDDSKEYYRRLLNNLLVQRTSDDCSIAVMTKSNTVDVFLNMNEQEFQEFFDLHKGKNSKAMRLLLSELAKGPQTKKALSRRVHTKEKAVSRRLTYLVNQNIVLLYNGKYYVR